MKKDIPKMVELKEQFKEFPMVEIDVTLPWLKINMYTAQRGRTKDLLKVLSKMESLGLANEDFDIWTETGLYDSVSGVYMEFFIR